MGAPELLPLFGLGVQQKSRPSNAQRRVNLYYEFLQDPDRGRMVAYGTPGLELFTTVGNNPQRGIHAPPDSQYFYTVQDSTFYQVDSAGTATSRGTLNTVAGPVEMDDNGRYVLVVDGVNGYTYDMNSPATNVAQVTDPQFPNGAYTATWVDGYFVCELAGGFHISDPNNPTAWPGDSAAAESSPDNLLRVLGDHQELTLFGGRSIEFHANTGNPDFPFERIPGSTSEWGLAARRSVAKFDESVVMLAQNRQGQVVAAKLSGYRIERISNHDLEAKWAAYGTFSDAVGYTYMLDGHPLYVLSFPTGGETWMFDGASGSWSQLLSHNETRHRSSLHMSYNGGNYVTDFENGKIYKVRSDVYTDVGDPIQRLLVGRHVFDGFGRVGVDAFQLDIESGVGLATGQGSNPQAMLRISKDGGRTWGAERWASFGAMGEYTKRCMWRRCGRARDFVFEVSISDPVKVAIMGAGIKMRGASS